MNDAMKTRDNEPYTLHYKTLVLNHPLFLMAVHDRYKLMSHPLSRSLLDRKFNGFSVCFFIFLFLLFSSFLAVFTTIAMRTPHPQYYYNQTGIDYNPDTCEDVIKLLNDTDKRSDTDAGLRVALIVLFAFLVAKNVWTTISYILIDFLKTVTFLMEIICMAFGFYFVQDASFQTDFKMRCTRQWEIGAFGLFIGYIALFYYVQYFPVIGVYVIMMRVILLRFAVFLPVLLVLITAFALTFSMIFQNFKTFEFVARGFAKIGTCTKNLLCFFKSKFACLSLAIMSTGEIDFNGFMYDDATEVYYKTAGFLIIIVFAIAMTILVSNLLIG